MSKWTEAVVALVALIIIAVAMVALIRLGASGTQVAVSGAVLVAVLVVIFGGRIEWRRGGFAVRGREHHDRTR